MELIRLQDLHLILRKLLNAQTPRGLLVALFYILKKEPSSLPIFETFTSQHDFVLYYSLRKKEKKSKIEYKTPLDPK